MQRQTSNWTHKTEHPLQSLNHLWMNLLFLMGKAINYAIKSCLLTVRPLQVDSRIDRSGGRESQSRRDRTASHQGWEKSKAVTWGDCWLWTDEMEERWEVELTSWVAACEPRRYIQASAVVSDRASCTCFLCSAAHWSASLWKCTSSVIHDHIRYRLSLDCQQSSQKQRVKESLSAFTSFKTKCATACLSGKHPLWCLKLH